MIQVNEALIRKVADLARLDLNNDEIQNYVQSIGDILKHVEQLNEVNTDGIEPMEHGIDGALFLREDIAVPFITDEKGEPKVLKSAPEVVHGGYKVPQII